MNYNPVRFKGHINLNSDLRIRREWLEEPDPDTFHDKFTVGVIDQNHLIQQSMQKVRSRTPARRLRFTVNNHLRTGEGMDKSYKGRLIKQFNNKEWIEPLADVWEAWWKARDGMAFLGFSKGHAMGNRNIRFENTLTIMAFTKEKPLVANIFTAINARHWNYQIDAGIEIQAVMGGKSISSEPNHSLGKFNLR